MLHADPVDSWKIDSAMKKLSLSLAAVVGINGCFWDMEDGAVILWLIPINHVLFGNAETIFNFSGCVLQISQHFVF